MSRLRFYLLFAVLYSCSSIGHSDAPLKPPKPVIIDIPATKAPEPVLHAEASGVVAPDDSAQKAAESMPPAVTAVTDNASSKLLPESGSTTETTDTSPPNPPPTTPAPAPAPTPAPGPLPPPDQGMWPYTDQKKNVTCIVVQFAAQLNVTYTQENKSTFAYLILNVPTNATVSNGSCEGDQWLTLSWLAAGTNLTNNMTMVYHKNGTTKNYGLKSLNISLTPELFSNVSLKGPVELYHGGEWQTPLATSYRCAAPAPLPLGAEGLAGELALSRLQEEAFRTAPGTGFSAARECGGGDVPDAVPIAVGCALGALVVVVLVAYLVARRRSAARGYLSM